MPTPTPPCGTCLRTWGGGGSPTNWVTAGNVGSIEKVGKKEGVGYLKATIVNGEDYMHFIFNRPTPLNAGLTEATGQLKLWFYVSKAADMKLDGQIEQTSSGQSDKFERYL